VSNDLTYKLDDSEVYQGIVSDINGCLDDPTLKKALMDAAEAVMPYVGSQLLAYAFKPFPNSEKTELFIVAKEDFDEDNKLINRLISNNKKLVESDEHETKNILDEIGLENHYCHNLLYGEDKIGKIITSGRKEFNVIEKMLIGSLADLVDGKIVENYNPIRQKRNCFSFFFESRAKMRRRCNLSHKKVCNFIFFKISKQLLHINSKSAFLPRKC